MTDEENIEQDNCSLETTARIVAEPVSCINNEPVTAFPVAQSYIFNIYDRHNQVQERNLETIRECGEILEVRINNNRQREEVLARHSQIDLDRYQNFPKFFFTRTKFYVLTLFCLNIIAINVSFAAAGAAMLRVNNISYI